MEVKKLCPLMYSEGRTTCQYCLEERCQFFICDKDGDEGKCAISVIAENVGKLSSEK